MLSLPALAKRVTHGFQVAKMELQFPSHSEWEVPLSSEILPLLDQPFYYLGKGAQSYVFESKDGKYVIKFFRYGRSHSEVKILTLFKACKIAYDLLKEETGLIYLHLNTDSVALPVLHCKDPIGRSRHLPLNRYRFAIQKKAKPFRQTLEEAMDNPELMQKRIDQFLSLLVARTTKGVFNTDPTLSRNFGFLEDRAIEIDFGNYRSNSSHNQLSEIKRYTERLHRWLSKAAPEWLPYLERRVEELQ